jgi:hypothetical protein
VPQEIRQLEHIGRQHKHIGRIPDDQGQAEQLEAQEEDQNAAVNECWPDERKADRQRNLPRPGTCYTSLVFELGIEPAQRGRRKKVHMRHMGQARDDDQAGHGIEVPRHEADEIPERQRREADRTDRNDIAECDHDRG